MTPKETAKRQEECEHDWIYDGEIYGITFWHCRECGLKAEQ